MNFLNFKRKIDYSSQLSYLQSVIKIVKHGPLPLSKLTETFDPKEVKDYGSWALLIQKDERFNLSVGYGKGKVEKADAMVNSITIFPERTDEITLKDLRETLNCPYEVIFWGRPEDSNIFSFKYSQGGIYNISFQIFLNDYETECISCTDGHLFKNGTEIQESEITADEIHIYLKS